MSSSRLFRRVSLHGFVLIAMVAAFIGPLAPVANAAGISIVDDGGSNDPNGDGQNDLTRLTGDDPDTATFFEADWSWDEPTTVKGGNAANACALFTTDTDGKINYAYCVEVSWTAQKGYFITDSGSGADSVKDFPAWIQCSNGKDDRCTQPTRIADPYTNPVIAATSTVAEGDTDPFPPVQGFTNGTPGGAGDDYPKDLNATSSISSSLIPAGARFVNVCSYPSAGNDGNNNPFDCVVTPGAGFLTIVKDAGDDTTTDFVFTSSAGSTNGTTSWTITGSGSVDKIPFAPTTTLDLNEAVPALWQLDSASCVIQPSTPTGSADAPPVQTGPISKGVQNFQIKSGFDTVCTFSDSIAVTPPVIDVTKTANPTSLPEPGGSVTFTVTVENNSSSAATLTVLDDDIYGDLLDTGNTNITDNTCDDSSPVTLDATDGTPGSGSDFFSCTFKADVTGEPGSPHTDTVTATATNDAGSSTDTDDATVTITDVAPTITVDKTANPTSVPESGGSVTYTVVVTNTSFEALTLNSLIDDKFGDLDGVGTCDVPQPLAASGSVGDSYSCTFSKTLSGNAGTSHVNTVEAKATDNDGSEAKDSDDATVTFSDVKPDISVTKTANPTSVLAPGGPVEFTFVVTNNAAENATITVLTDNKFGTLTGDADCQVGTVLAANGGNCEFKATFNVTGAGGTSHTNVFSATASDDDGNSDTATDDATVTILSQTGQIAPTATTCQNFVGGTAGNLTEILYGLKGNKINSVAPGVLFYYSLVTVPAGTHTIDVTQTTSPSFIPFAIQQDQAVLYSYPGCVKLTNNSTGVFTGITGGTYIVGIKYNPGTVVGATNPGDVIYTFTTRIDTVAQPSSADSLTLRKKPNH